MGNLAKIDRKYFLTTGFAQSDCLAMVKNPERDDYLDLEGLEVLGQLKAHIRKGNIRQKDLAQKIGVRDNHFSQMLSGVRGMRFSQFLRIVEITGYIPPQFRNTKKEEIDMSTVQHREAITEIIRKLHRLDNLGGDVLIKASAYLDGLLELAGDKASKKLNHD